MARTIVVEPGRRTRILWIFSSSIPGQVRFRAEPLEGETLRGTIELRRKRWLKWESEVHDLSPSHVFEKGMSDGDFRLYVTPEQRTRVTFETRHFRAENLIWVLAGILGLAIAAGLTGVIVRLAG